MGTGGGGVTIYRDDVFPSGYHVVKISSVRKLRCGCIKMSVRFQHTTLAKRLFWMPIHRCEKHR